jgi:hypothetical protein
MKMLYKSNTPNENDDFYMKLKIRIFWTFGEQMARIDHIKSDENI